MRVASVPLSSLTAVDSTLNQQADLLRNLDPHYAERANDILDLRDRLLHELLSIRAVGRLRRGANEYLV